MFTWRSLIVLKHRINALPKISYCAILKINIGFQLKFYNQSVPNIFTCKTVY